MKTQQVKDYKVRVGSLVRIGVTNGNPQQYAGDETVRTVSRVLGKIIIEGNERYPAGEFTLIESEADNNGFKLVGWLTEVIQY